MSFSGEPPPRGLLYWGTLERGKAGMETFTIMELWKIEQIASHVFRSLYLLEMCNANVDELGVIFHASWDLYGFQECPEMPRETQKLHMQDYVCEFWK